MGRAKIVSVEEAISQIKEGDTVAIASFYSVGAPLELVDCLVRMGTRHLRIITNDPGIPDTGRLIDNGQVDEVIISYVATNPRMTKLFAENKVPITLIPQGTLITQLWAGGAGLGGFLTPTGVGTAVENEKTKIKVGGKEYLLELPFKPKFGLVRAYRADKLGNLVYRRAARNFNPTVAMAAEITIAEVEKPIFEIGELDPDEIITPFVFVNYLVQENPSWRQKINQIVKERTSAALIQPGRADGTKQREQVKRERIAKRAAKELKDGNVVNLGIGIPTLVVNYIPPGVDINIQSENGFVRMGPEPPEGEEDCDLVNAGGRPMTIRPGGAVFDSLTSFAMIRGGAIDVTILGALEVDEKGNLANYMIPGKMVPGIGGGMDLVVGAKKVIIAMEHTTAGGQPKIVSHCSLPLTAKGEVNLIITELAVIEVTPEGLVMKEIAADASVEEVKAKTGANLIINSELKIMD